LLTPSAASSTIRARCASPALTADDLVRTDSRSRSPSRNAEQTPDEQACTIISPE
jgi:hypothetical protein